MKTLEMLSCVVGLAVLASVSSLPSRVEKQAGVQVEGRHRAPGPRPTNGGSPPPNIISIQQDPCEIIPWILEMAGNDLTEEDKEELEDYMDEMCNSSTESEERFFFNRPNPLQALNTLCTRLNSFIAGVSGLVVTGNDLASANASQLIATVITNMCGARRSLLMREEEEDSTQFPPPPFDSHPAQPIAREEEDSEEGTRPPPPSGGPPPPLGGHPHPPIQPKH
ncbi:hypothetical protein Pmani_003288 [Petrolisthes manimaculis]|uniref:Uncharacterized protein n=1 Tax=Petrolisthes manimaculis TaxID=1843537 RepID=A0AAE1UQ62_9EUCA|nr:hypothetical protein Pmani_003288 [Petrolisthes manimaculis]